jgi:Domain of unknown function (DUF4129)
MPKHEKDSWGWQIEKTLQQVGEWIETKLRFESSDAAIPQWIVSLITNILWLFLAAGVAITLYLILRKYFPKIGLERLWQKSTAPQIAKTLTISELLAQAQYYQNQQNYSEAGRYLYLAMLQRLNDTNIIPHQFSRTDREYSNLLNQIPSFRPSDLLLKAHEELEFADRPLTAAQFDRCQQAYRQLDAQLSPSQPPS